MAVTKFKFQLHRYFNQIPTTFFKFDLKMNINPQLTTSSQSPPYSEFLLHLEELPTPETIKKLQARIHELEDRLLEQNKQAHCRELDFHRHFNEKKGQWVLKYLELKSELANTKNSYEERNNQWEQDASQLVKIIKFLTNTVKTKEEQANTIIKALDADFSLILNHSQSSKREFGTADTGRVSQSSACNSHRGDANNLLKGISSQQSLCNNYVFREYEN